MILVTGGAGFIGSHIVDALVEQGHAVRAVDALLPVAHAARPSYLNPDAEWLEGDLRDPAVAERAVAGVGAVCHQASMVGLGTDIGDIADYVGHNDLATALLLRALAGTGFTGRLVLASSMVVYGEGSYRCARARRGAPGPRRAEALDAGGFEPPCPSAASRSRRGRSTRTRRSTPQRLRRDQGRPGAPVRGVLARDRCAGHGAALPQRLRPADAARHPYAGVASIFRSALEAGRAPRVFEDGGQRRDFVHVRDVARANLCALLAAEPVAGAFNVASGTPHSVLEMAAALADAFEGAERPVVTGEWRGGDVRHIVASAERAAGGLGFRAREEFEAGMREFATAPLR